MTAFTFARGIGVNVTGSTYPSLYDIALTCRGIMGIAEPQKIVTRFVNRVGMERTKSRVFFLLYAALFTVIIYSHTSPPGINE